MKTEERNKVLYDFNNTKMDYPKEKTISQLFEEQVERTPDNIAVVFEDKKLTYKELNEKSNSLAHYLRNSEISRNDIVGIMMNRSLEMIVSILAVLKSGACYIPIDPDYPQDRITYMLDNSNSKYLLTFKNFDDKTRNKIRKAQSRGVEIFEGDREKNIKLFYSFIARKQPHNLTYYKNFAESFNKNFEIYFARLNTEKYLQNIKKLYEIEVEKLENLNSEIQAKSVTNEITEKLMNEKIESDKLVATYKKELQDASKLFEKYKTGIIIGTIGIVLDRNGVEFLIDGQNPAYGLFYPLYLLKWHIIDKYAKQGAVYFDLNAITGYFGDNNKYRGLNESKLGFGADVTEYVGEFDLIIKPTLYKWYCESPLFRSIMKPAK